MSYEIRERTVLDVVETESDKVVSTYREEERESAETDRDHYEGAGTHVSEGE